MSDAEITTILGAGASFEGKLTYEGAVRIDGRFAGEISTEGALLVGPGAEVRATIRAGSIIIEGRVHGDVVATKALDLRASGRLVGNLTTPSLAVERGAVLEGQCRMETDASGRVQARDAALEPRVN
jgi:cytoskeletal protein CcmA (bactofilin family)